MTDSAIKTYGVAKLDGVSSDSLRLWAVSLRNGVAYDNEGFDTTWYVWSEQEPTRDEIVDMIYDDVKDLGLDYAREEVETWYDYHDILCDWVWAKELRKEKCHEQKN